MSMIDKYLGFKTISNDTTVIESLLNHTKIDENEIIILKEMFSFLCSNRIVEVQSNRDKIFTISKESSRELIYIEEQIIQSHFDFQKQHDLLRIFQRIESVSQLIATCADYIIIFIHLKGRLPLECQDNLLDMIDTISKNHLLLKLSLTHYISNKDKLISTIHSLTSNEKIINAMYLESIEQVYALANENKIMKGHMRALENMYLSLETLGNAIETAATSLEWLLIT